MTQFSVGRVVFGLVTDTALAWLESYLTDRRQFVKLERHRSGSVLCDLGVPQGLVLGHLLFVTYVSPFSNIITSAGLGFHQYADDTQIYFAMRHATICQDIDTLRTCTERLCCLFLNNAVAESVETMLELFFRLCEIRA